MSTLMFYKKLVPLNRELHKDLRLKPLVKGFSYAANENALPCAMAEMVQACIEYPIAFALDGDQPGGPILLTGIRNNENLFVGADGRWDADYVPTFVRRYPFILHEQDEETFGVLFDEDYEGFSQTEGERLFKEDGTETEMFARMVEFLSFFRGQGNFGRDFVSRLIELDLLIPQGIEVTTNKGEKITLQGFHIVEEKRVMALPDDKLLQLARSGDLALIYAHLASLGNIQKMIRRLEDRINAESAPAA